MKSAKFLQITTKHGGFDHRHSEICKISSNLRFVSNILSSLAIIHAGKRDQGGTCPLSSIDHWTRELNSKSVVVAPPLLQNASPPVCLYE